MSSSMPPGVKIRNYLYQNTHSSINVRSWQHCTESLGPKPVSCKVWNTHFQQADGLIVIFLIKMDRSFLERHI